MKKLLFLCFLSLTSVFAYSQKDSTKLKYEKDAFTEKEYLKCEPLLVSNDGKYGFTLSPTFTKKSGKWEYQCILGTSTVGRCFEHDKVYFIFDDSTKFDMVSWNNFNCSGSSYFDLSGKFREKVSKSIKAIRFVNGRTYDSFDKVLTDSKDKNYFINVFKALDEYNQSH